MHRETAHVDFAEDTLCAGADVLGVARVDVLLRVPFVELLFGEFSGIEGSERYQRDISMDNHTRKGLGRLTGGDGNDVQLCE